MAVPYRLEKSCLSNRALIQYHLLKRQKIDPRYGATNIIPTPDEIFLETSGLGGQVSDSAYGGREQSQILENLDLSPPVQNSKFKILSHCVIL